MSSEIVTVDVRDDIRNGHEPFGKIMKAVARLRPDEKLLLVASFEPIPLTAVLTKQGFIHESRRTESGDWEVLFTRAGGKRNEVEKNAPPPVSSGGGGSEPSSFIKLDARGLEPPQPLVKILEALATLPTGAGLRVRTDRRPMHLYAHLEERGFVSETKEQTDGSFLTHIRRR